jgi:phosphohistidine swiveling domain-containing protein
MPELTTPLKNTFIYQEQIELLNIAVRIVKDNSVKDLYTKYSDGKRIFEETMNKNEKIYKLIYSHYKNYRWISYLYQEPAYELEYYMHRLKDLVLDESSIGRLLSRYKNGKKKTQDVRKIIINELKFNKKQLQLLEFARGLTYIKEYRKAVIAHGTFCKEKVYSELSKKYNISLDQIRMLDYYELKKAVESNFFDKGELNKRIEGATFYYERGAKRKVYTGKESENFISKIEIIEKKDQAENSLEGTIASSGKVRGVVKVLNQAGDIDKMEEGDILVTRITATNLGPAVNKAAGIISECGGLTCHAAILSRELKVPCLVGVDDATKKLKDGDEVELDVDEGVVNIMQ